MKTIRFFNPFSVGLLFLALFLEMVLLSSCEKAEEFPITYSESTNEKTESLVVHKADWCCVNSINEVCLPVKGYRKGVKYDYIKVFIKAERPNASMEEWLELPYEETSYRLVDYKIIIEKYDSLDQNEYYFLVKMMVSS